MDIDGYKELFERLDKSDIFELNKPFIEEIIELKNRIVKVREIVGENYLIVHPSVPGKIRVSESEVWLLKLEEQYKRMITTLNKIIGAIDTAESDPLEEWINEHKIRPGEGND